MNHINENKNRNRNKNEAEQDSCDTTIPEAETDRDAGSLEFSLESDPDFEIEDLSEEFEYDEDFEQNVHPFFKRFNPHFILLGLAALILIIAAFKLIQWNRGEKIHVDPNEDTSQFDVESEDYVMHLTPDALAGRTDDGITTILALGNEPFASERGENGIAAQLEKQLGGNSVVYNAAFEATTLSCKNSVYDENYVTDAFSLYWLSKTIALQDFTLLDNSIDKFAASSPSAEESLDTLKSVDMDTVDIITIFYDGTDYLEDRIITSPYDLYDAATCTGSLNGALSILRETYPYIRIILLSPTFACQIDENGDYLPGSSTNTPRKNGFLSDYMIAQKNVAVQNGVTFIDNYYGTINEDNYKKYLEDNIHLNDAGRELAAKRIKNMLTQ